MASMVDMVSMLIYRQEMTTQPTRVDQIPAPPRRAATRARIVAGAKEVFFTNGFAAAMMDEIAAAAGTRRSTIYLHFSEKEDILAAVAEEYTEKIREVIALLPAPQPTYDQLRQWVSYLAEFVSRERAPTELLVALSHLPEIPEPAKQFGDAFKVMLGARLPKFAQAISAGGITSAWALAALENMCWALCHFARQGSSQAAIDRLTVATEILARAIQCEIR